jgi:hypothetical protein
MQDDWVPVQLSDNIDEMLTAWIESAEPKVGWCLLCNRPIRTEVDFIPGTNTHDCEAGREFEAENRLAQRKPRCRGNRHPRQNS